MNDLLRRRRAMMEKKAEELYLIGTDIIEKYIGRNESTGYALLTANKRINPSDGQYISTSLNYAASDVYMEISPKYRYQKSALRIFDAAWYDENFEFISYFNMDNNNIQSLPAAPSNAKYLRFATRKTQDSWRITIKRIK